MPPSKARKPLKAKGLRKGKKVRDFSENKKSAPRLLRGEEGKRRGRGERERKGKRRGEEVKSIPPLPLFVPIHARPAPSPLLPSPRQARSPPPLPSPPSPPPRPRRPPRPPRQARFARPPRRLAGRKLRRAKSGGTPARKPCKKAEKSALKKGAGGGAYCAPPDKNNNSSPLPRNFFALWLHPASPSKAPTRHFDPLAYTSVSL